MNLFYVDDNKLNCLLMNKQFTKHKTKIKIFNSGIDAIEYFDNNPAYDDDVILMDIEMPEMDGYETAKQIKNKNGNCNIIAFTTLKHEEMKKVSYIDTYYDKTKYNIKDLLYFITTNFIDKYEQPMHI